MKEAYFLKKDGCMLLFISSFAPEPLSTVCIVEETYKQYIMINMRCVFVFK